MPPPPFGRLLTAMVTPFRADGALDLDAAAALAVHLVLLITDGYRTAPAFVFLHGIYDLFGKMVHIHHHIGDVILLEVPDVSLQ